MHIFTAVHLGFNHGPQTSEEAIMKFSQDDPTFMLRVTRVGSNGLEPRDHTAVFAVEKPAVSEAVRLEARLRPYSLCLRNS